MNTFINTYFLAIFMEEYKLKWNADIGIVEGLVKKLLDVEHPDKRIHVCGGDYSSRELVQEVYKGSAVGRYLYEVHQKILNKSKDEKVRL